MMKLTARQCMDIQSWFLGTGIASSVLLGLYYLFLFGCDAWDYPWHGPYPPADGASVNWDSWLLLLIIPLICYVGFIAFNQFENRINMKKKKDKYEEICLTNFRSYCEVKRYDSGNSKILKQIWEGAVIECQCQQTAISRLLRNISSTWSASLISSIGTCASVKSHVLDTKTYIEPVLEDDLDNTDLFMQLTERMANDVAQLVELRKQCEILYIKAKFPSNHMNVITTEINSLIKRIEAIDEVDNYALTSGVK